MRDKYILIIILIFSISFSLFGSDAFVKIIMQEEEAALKVRIENMKKEKNSLFFAVTSTKLNEQEELAKYEIEQIKKLSETSGLDYPDHSKIYEHMKNLLNFTPNTEMAKRAHWEIHKYYIGLMDDRKDYKSAIEALESFLAKYKIDDFYKREAYDKLSIFWEKEKNWKRTLFYSQKYLDIQENYPQLLNKAEALIALEQYKTGKKLLERIINESPDSVQYHLAISMMDKLAFDSNVSPEKINYKKTIATMRHIALALAVYYLDKMKYPAQLKDLFPEYLPGGTPIIDEWGNAILLKISKDGKTFLLGSGGSDGKFNGFDQSQGFYKEMNGRDIIHSDYYLLLGPEGMGN